MRRRKYLVTVGTMFCLAAGILAGGKVSTVCAAENTLPQEDLSKGVTYELDDSGNIQFINLHGNSVIIEDVPVEDGGSVKYRNFYIDRNRNGEIDSDEKKVSFSRSTGGELDEEGTGCPVYGLYGTSSTTPIRITVKGTKHSVIYGVYNGQLETEGEMAVTIDLQTDQLSMACGACNSKVSSVDMQVNGNVNTCFGAMGDSTVDEVQVHINNGMQEQIYGAQSCVIGSLDMEIARSNSETSGSIYGVQGGKVDATDSTKPAIKVVLQKGSVGSICAMSGANVVTGQGVLTAVAVELQGGNIQGSLTGIFGGTVTMADTTGKAVNLDVVNGVEVKGEIKGITNPSSGSSTRMQIMGSVDIDIDGGEQRCKTNIWYAVDGAVDLNGGITFDIDHTDATCGVMLAQNNAVIDEDITLNIASDASVTGGPGIVGISSAVARKNVTMNVHGLLDDGSCTDYLTGVQGRASGYDYAVEGNLVINYTDGTWGNVCGVSSSAVKGDVILRIKKGCIQSLQGMTGSNIGGDAKVLIGRYAVEESDGIDIPDAVVKINGSQGISGFEGTIGGDCEFKVNNSGQETSGYYSCTMNVFSGDCQIDGSLIAEIEGGSYGSCNRNSSQHKIGGDCSVTVTGIEVGECNGLYGTSVNGTCEVTLKDIDSSSTIIAIQDGVFDQDVTVTTSGNQATAFYGLNRFKAIQGNLVMNCDGDQMPEGTSSYYGEFYAICSGYNAAGVIKGSADVVVKNCDFNQFYGIYETTALGETTIQLQGGSYVNAVTPIAMSGSNISCKRVAFTADNTVFGKTDATWKISNSVYGSGKIMERFADTCTLNGTYTVDNRCADFQNVDTTGSLQLDLDGDRYYAGYCLIAEDVTAKNIHTCNGTLLHVSKDAAMKVDEDGYFYVTAGTKCLVEGALDGKIDLNEGKYCTFYMNGGTLTSTENLQCIYYPVSFEYEEKAGTLTWSGVNTLSLCQDVKFGMVGNIIYVTGTAKKGYELQGAYAKKESDKDYSNMAAGTSDNSYKYTMTAEPVAIRMDFAGTQISLGKSAPDPIAKLNEATTAEEPLYDMADVIISNDGEEGELTYALVEEQSNMPEGLQFTDGKIYGTPTVLNETGSKVVIRVTGRNGSTADLSLVIKVTETGEGTGSQEGRIRVDAEKQEVHLQGNSVVIAANGEETAVYIDDNLDGVADFEEPAYSGDLSAYTVYGITGATIRRPLQLTMTGGTVKSITVVENADVSTKTETDAVKMQMTGGEVVGGITMAEDAEITGTMALCISGDATYKVVNMTYGNNVTYDGWYQDIKGDVTIDGVYSILHDTAMQTLKIKNSGKCTVAGTVTLTIADYLDVGQLTYLYNNGSIETSKTYINSAGYVYNRGTYNCTGTFSNSGRFLVIDDGALLPTDNEFARVYYPVTMQSELKNTSITKDTSTMPYYSVDDDVMVFGWAGADCSISATDAPGYVAYISINGGKSEKMEDNKYTFSMPRKATSLQLSYQPVPIQVDKAFADPTAVIGKEYTVEDPLYNLNNLVVTNDTTGTYGRQDRTYELQAGSELPDGLTLSEGKVIGKATTDAKDCDVTFIVTGRNGTTADVPVHIAVTEELVQKDINDMVKVNGYMIDLQGTSVVIRSEDGDINKTSIYLDADHDGIADNADALQIREKTQVDLTSYTIYGCTKASEDMVDGDISIYMYGGRLDKLYGAYGEINKPLTINANVAVYVKGGTVNTYTAAAEYATAKNVTLDVQGGELKKNVYAAYEPQDVDHVYFRFSDAAAYYNNFSGNSYRMAVSYNGTVKNVTAMVGNNKNGGFSGSYASFWGVYNTTVSGDVQYTIDGNWKPTNVCTFATKATIAGNMNVDWKSGTLSAPGNTFWYPAFLNGSTAADLNVSVPAGAEIGGDVKMTVSNSTVNNVKLDAPDVKGNATAVLRETNGSSKITNSAYVNLNGAVEVDGTYTLEESLEADKFTTYSNAKLTIAEGVSVVNTGEADLSGTVVNHGTWNSRDKLTINGTLDNYGELSSEVVGSTSAIGLRIESLGKLINREDAVCELASKVNNVGKIVNYGNLEQSYYSSESTNMTSVGNIYTTTKPKMRATLKNYKTIYYAVQTDYIEEYVSKITLTNNSGEELATSGVDEDDNRYLAGGEKFYVQVDMAAGEESKTVSSITYNNGTASDESMTETVSGKWMGTLGYEPTIATLHFEGVTSITLDKDSDVVEEAQVGVTYLADQPLYDLTQLSITNDDEEGTGSVTYTVDPSTSLPTGLKLVNGVICGTPSRASDTAQAVKILVKGKNHTTAVFTLTFTKIEKGTPAVLIPDNLTASAGDALSAVALPDYSQRAAQNAGTYAWKEPDTVVGTSGEKEETYTAIFTPKDTANYNWDTCKGEDGTISVEIPVTIGKRTPEFTTPTKLTTVYGDTFADVLLPEDENGTFTWADGVKMEDKVGNVGAYTYYLDYTPKDQTVYEKVSGIAVKLVVQPKKVTAFAPAKTVFEVEAGETLGDIVLPTSEDGTYSWYTIATTIPENKGTYKILFKPNDVKNYDWSGVEGYDPAYKGVIVDVTVKVMHVHDYGKTWKSDKTYHWKECECGEVDEKAEHDWDAGKVTKEVTATEAGEKTYTCKVCAVTRTEAIPATGEEPEPPHTHKYGTTWKSDKTYHWKECECGEIDEKAEHNWDAGKVTKEATATEAGEKTYTCKVCAVARTEVIPAKGNTGSTDPAEKPSKPENPGQAEQPSQPVTPTTPSSQPATEVVTEEADEPLPAKGTILTDESTKARFRVLSGEDDDPQVEYVGTTNKKATNINIPEVVTLDDIDYDVVAIASGAFKNNKDLKKIVIPESVEKIGSKAFYGCKKLTNITIKTTKLTTKTVGSKAFAKAGSNNYKKLTVKVPKKQMKLYKTMLRKRGLSAKAKIK